ncbi:MAG: ACT domain-containing protein [Lachnospiraceae bacterium]|jgi:ACT domain-containing protein
MHKIIITVVGKDTVGIIARVCTYLSENNINVNDISQTIIDGYFNMMMIVDMSASSGKLEDIQKGLKAIGDDMGLVIQAQSEEIFNMMHRI